MGKNLWWVVRVALIAIVITHLTISTSVFAQEKIFERWKGNFSQSLFECSKAGADGIIIDGLVTIEVPVSGMKISCPILIFRNDGKILANGPLEIEAGRLQGALSLSVSWHTKRTILAPRRASSGGRNGRTGRPGINAKPAPKSQFAGFPVKLRIGRHGKRGTHGLSGKSGRDGSNGAPGKKGPSVLLKLDWIEKGSSIRVVSEGQSGADGQTGGQGGNGGSGGNGGKGGNGSHGTFVFIPGKGGNGGRGGHGANGGDGGNGGRGGHGGDGGDIKVIFTKNSFAHTSDIPLDLRSIGASAGTPGAGAVAGSGGRRGVGGRGGRGGRSHQANDAPSAKKGLRGRNGRAGASGRSGRLGNLGMEGLIGNVIWGDDSFSIEDLVSRLTRK